MWYRQTLDVVRIRHALRALLAEGASADDAQVAEMLDALAEIANDNSHPAGGEDLRREWQRWRARAGAARDN